MVPERSREGQAWVAAFNEGLEKVGWTEDRNVRIGWSCRSATKGSSSPHASRFREKGVECKQQPDQRNSYEQDVDPGHGWLLYAPLQRRAPTATKESRLLLGPRLPTGRPPVSSPGLGTEAAVRGIV